MNLPQPTSPVGVTGYLAKIDADKGHRDQRKKLEKQRILADKVHRVKTELCQTGQIRRGVVDGCVKAIIESDVEVRITFYNQNEGSYAVEQIPKLLLKLDLADKDKTLTRAASKETWPVLELRNGSAILFKLEPKGSLQTT